MAINLTFVRFQEQHYPEYAAWFSDPELDHQLGPMDEEWLSAILAEKEDEGITWAVLFEQEMVGVIETVFDPQNLMPAAITAIAVKPTRRRQGFARAIFDKILLDDHRKGINCHICYIHQGNAASRNLCEGIGFTAVSEPDNNGYIQYQHIWV